MYSIPCKVYHNGVKTDEFDLVRDATFCHGYSLGEATRLLKDYIISCVIGGGALTYSTSEYKLAYGDGVVEYVPAYPIEI